MARLNPKRRRQIKLHKAAQLVADMRNEHDDAWKLQQGRVGCSLERSARHYTLTRPRESEPIAPAWYWDGPCKKWQGDK